MNRQPSLAQKQHRTSWHTKVYTQEYKQKKKKEKKKDSPGCPDCVTSGISAPKQRITLIAFISILAVIDYLVWTNHLT